MFYLWAFVVRDFQLGTFDLTETRFQVDDLADEGEGQEDTDAFAELTKRSMDVLNNAEPLETSDDPYVEMLQEYVPSHIQSSLVLISSA